jgi:hypothetical protein
MHIINSEVEEEDFTTCLNGKMTKSNDEKKHYAKDNMLDKYHSGFQKGKGRHENNNTKVKNGFQ